MRGEVIDYSAEAGGGLISGEDGVRYSFTADRVKSAEALTVGSRVDFVPLGESATEIYVLAGGPRPLESTGEDLSLWEYFRKCMRLYAEGDGRARRKEYWSFVLFSSVFMIAGAVLLAVLVGLVVGLFGMSHDGGSPDFRPVHWIILATVAIGLIFFTIPSFAVTSRRLHDVGMSGWFTLVTLVPYLGGLFGLVIALLPSQEETNRYGKYPKPLRR